MVGTQKIETKDAYQKALPDVSNTWGSFNPEWSPPDDPEVKDLGMWPKMVMGNKNLTQDATSIVKPDSTGPLWKLADDNRLQVITK